MGVENRTFKGGIHVEEYKELSSEKPIVQIIPPSVVKIPLRQHIGMPCEPLVAVGDRVKVGQKIGEARSNMSANVHASIAGTVIAIEEVTTTQGLRTQAVVVESDGSDEKDYVPTKDIDALDGKAILGMIKEAGIVGLGGAAFPTHIKLDPPPGKKIDTLIVNAAECEPYITCDDQLMRTRAVEILKGAEFAMKALGVDKAYIAIENNKPQAQNAIQSALNAHPYTEMVKLATKYPQGDEKRIIDATLSRQVPSGGLPMDVGVVVINVSTTFAVYEAVALGKPLYERAVTMTGHALKETNNFLVPFGTPLNYLLDLCGGFTGAPGKILTGGPMMGEAQQGIEAPVQKGTSSVIVMTKEEAIAPVMSACIRCGKCVEVCPVGLQPLYIQERALKGFYELANEYNMMDCIECGSCSFICPAKRPLVEAIKLGKRELRNLQQKVKA